MAQQYGAETPGPDWRERLVCSKCGSREIDMVVTGTKRCSGHRWQAHTVARTRAETPDAHCAFGEQSRATGLQMPRASSTIPAPAIIISEAAPAPAQKPAAQSSA